MRTGPVLAMAEKGSTKKAEDRGTKIDGTNAQAKKTNESVKLLEKFASVRFVWQQLEVAQQLVVLGDPTVIPKIEKYLDTMDRRRRCNAGLVLAGLGDKRGVAIIIAELEDMQLGSRYLDPDSARGQGRDGKPSGSAQIGYDRYHAAFLLGQLKMKEAVAPLIVATKDERINYQAAISLGQIGDKRAIPLSPSSSSLRTAPN